jgi:DNA-binding SARP family transcriptional activator
MRFGILGPLQVVDDGGRELTVGGSKPRALVAILLLHEGEAVSSDRLVEDLWSGEPPASAAKALQVHVSRLRAALADGLGGKDRLQTTAGGYLLRVESGELDAERFERLLEEGGAAIAAGNPERAVATFSGALVLWRGGPLCDFGYDSFAQAEIARLSELRAVALEQRIAAELALGREGQVIGALERLVREHPYRERLRGHLMLALYRSGRQAEALAAYRDARLALVDELGIEPSAELRQLHGAILAQDGSLLQPVATRAAPGPAAEEPLDAPGVAPNVSGSGGPGVDTSAVGAVTVVAC